MAPMGSRKRVKPNPAIGSGTSTSTATPTTTPTPPPSAMPSQDSSKSSQSDATPIQHDTSQPSKSDANGDVTPTHGKGTKQVHKTRSWYGSWPRVPKSAASTQVARETILGGTSKPKGTADFSRFETRKSDDTTSINEGTSPGSAMPKIPEDTPSPDGHPPVAAPPVSEVAAKPDDKPDDKPSDKHGDEPGDKPGDKTESEDAVRKLPYARQEGQSTEPPSEQPAEPPVEQQPPVKTTSERPVSGWFGWLGRPIASETVESTTAPSPEPAGQQEDEPAPESKAREADKKVQPAKEPSDAVTSDAVTSDAVETPTQPVAQDKATATSVGSWLWSWSNWSAPAPVQPEPEPVSGPQTAEPQAAAAKEPEDVVVEDAPAAEVAPEPPTPAPKAGSTWAFWSRDAGSASSKKPSQKGEQGQLAIMGERSENKPQRANSMEFKSAPAKEPSLKSGQKDEPSKNATTPSRESSTKSSKRARPQSMEVDNAAPVRPSTPKADATTKPAAAKTPTSTTKALPPNLLLPSFESTYKYKDNPSIVKQIAQLLLRTQQSSTKHVYLTREPPRIKKAIAIGVHGLFPANYLRPMIGQPTGTSIKFANHCAEAVRRWADSHGCENCEIEKVALEGEGKIGERVENLWKLLLNWIDHIRNADLILIGCHSQGVPVSIILLAKLIELGVVGSAKVGVCAMAGVSLGPFPDYRSSMGILMGTAAELWEFADPQSVVSKRLEASIKVVLSYGARLTFIGSIDDQLVPLESAIYAPAHHPYIYRAVFINGRIHAPDFIAHLVGFALKLRNLGVSDHGLIRELSTPLAGSLYSGEGHSRLYDDERVYDLAVSHALETTDVPGGGTGIAGAVGRGAGGGGGGCGVACEVHHRPGGSGALSNPNPYHLPWIMRGLLEEDFVKTELSNETAELVRQFDDWRPVTKALKDVKYRLEAVRSKL